MSVPCLQEALNVLPNTATVKDTAALDEFQRVETERGARPPPKKGLGEHMNDEANWKKVTLALARCFAGPTRLSGRSDIRPYVRIVFARVEASCGSLTLHRTLMPCALLPSL